MTRKRPGVRTASSGEGTARLNCIRCGGARGAADRAGLRWACCPACAMQEVTP